MPELEHTFCLFLSDLIANFKKIITFLPCLTFTSYFLMRIVKIELHPGPIYFFPAFKN